MSQQGLLKRVVEVLQGLDVPYMLSGSLASSLQGRPRATHDIDLVVDIRSEDVDAVVEGLSRPELYVDRSAVAEAVNRRGMFNLIDTSSGDKVDFWLLKDEEYDRSRLGRRRSIEALGLNLAVSSPEDTILMKLRWGRDSGGSEKQTTDAVSVYELQEGALDEGYLDRWAAELGVTEELARLREQAR